MKILNWIEKKLTPPPDVIYIHALSEDDDAAMKAALKVLKERSEKRRMEDVLDKPDPARSIRG